jgi:hypothetical protein
MASLEARERPDDGVADGPASKRVKLDVAPLATEDDPQKPPRVKGLAMIKKEYHHR